MELEGGTLLRKNIKFVPRCAAQKVETPSERELVVFLFEMQLNCRNGCSCCSLKIFYRFFSSPLSTYYFVAAHTYEMFAKTSLGSFVMSS